MPRYFFHLYDDETAIDEEGMEFPGLEEACANGIKEARELMLDTVAEGWITLSHRIDIADETGAIVSTVTFGDAMAIEE